MAGIKISALPAVPSALLTDFFPVVQGGVTSKETLTQVGTLFGFDSGTGLLSLAKGGTNANLTAALGAIPYLTASAFALLAPGTTGQLFRSGGAGAPTWTTTTYPATNAINTIMYASSANVVGVITPVNSALMISSAGGVPSWSNSAIPAFTMAGALNMGTHLINNVVDPVSAQDAATKNYVDTLITGGGAPVVAATTGALTVTQAGAGIGATLTNAGVQAAFSIDGQSPTVGQRVLIKNQASTSQNGVYTVTNVGSGATNWVLTRATDYDTPADINATGVIPVTAGTVNANTGWINTTPMVTVDTTPVTFVQFGASFPISLANGGTGASLTASNGGIFYSNASTGAILAGTATAQQLLMSGASTTPQWSTTTYPLTNAINTIMYASSANVLGVITPANSSILVSGVSGIPAWSTTLPAFTTSSITFSPTTGGIVGTTTNDNAAAGKVGEVISSSILYASKVNLTNNTATNVTSISLTAGDWDCYGNVYFEQDTVAITEAFCWMSLTSATTPDKSLYAGTIMLAVAGNNPVSFIAPFLRVSLAAPATLYLTALSQASAGQTTGCGNLYARRAR